jgi:type I restriction enzyme S subunit
MIEEWKTPRYWGWVPINQIAKTSSGGTPSRRNPAYFEGDIPWIKSGELTDGLVKTCSEFISEEAVEKSSAKIFPKGTLLIAMYGATVGKLGILDLPAATNQAVCAIFQEKTVHRDYLFWYLRSIRPQLISLSFGGAQPNISQTVIKNTTCPIPYPDEPERSLAEQRRIVARIEALLGEVREMRGLHEQITADTGRLMEAVRHELFSNIEDAPILKFDDVAQNRLGKMLSKDSKKGDYLRPYMRNANVQWDKIHIDDVSEMNFPPKDQDTFLLKKGDILICEGGDIGRTAVWNDELAECYFQKALHRARVRDSLNPPRYLLHYMAWASSNGAIAKLKTGAAIPHLTGVKLKTLDVIWPDPDKQVQIVEYLDSIKKEIDEMGILQNADTQLIQNLEQSILTQAFKGEL